MTVEALSEFFNKVEEDVSLQKELESLRVEEQEATIRYQALADFGHQHGYEFTTEEVEQLQQVRKAMLAEESEELSEEQLEAVAGGFFKIPSFIREPLKNVATSLAKKGTEYLVNRLL